MRLLRTRDLVELTGVSRRQVNYWTRQGLISHENDASGSSKWNRWKPATALKVAFLARVSHAGMNPAAFTRLLTGLEETRATEGLRQGRLVAQFTLGPDVTVRVDLSDICQRLRLLADSEREPSRNSPVRRTRSQSRGDEPNISAALEGCEASPDTEAFASSDGLVQAGLLDGTAVAGLEDVRGRRVADAFREPVVGVQITTGSLLAPGVVHRGQAYGESGTL